MQRDIGLAKQAFQKKDSALSKLAHSRSSSIDDGGIAESGHHKKESFLRKCIVYGGFEGLCVSGVLMAVLSSNALLPAQILSLCAGTIFSLAVGFACRDFVRHRAEHEYYRVERAREEWELDNYEEGEVNEMIELYESMGISRADAKTIIHTMAKYKTRFVDLMMLQELHITPPQGSPIASAFATFMSFLLIGAIPVAAYVWRSLHHANAETTTSTMSPLAAGLTTTLITSAALTVTNWTILPRENSRSTYILLFVALCAVITISFTCMREVYLIEYFNLLLGENS